MTDEATTTHNGDPALASADTPAPDPVAAFVDRFAAAWSVGERGFDGFDELMTPDGHLTQPMMPDAHGRDGWRAQFDALFGAIPDLRGDTLSWGRTPDGALIELELHGTLAGRRFTTTTVDRIVLRDGLMAERHARMDPLPMLRAGLGSPRTALRLLRPPRGATRAPKAAGVSDTRLDTALTGLAIGRLVLGTAARVAPRATAKAFGAGHASSPEFDYLMHVFGARAVGLGSSYLLNRNGPRRLAQRIALAIDVSDTLSGVGQLRRREVPVRTGLPSVALTGAYAAIGAAKLARDVRR
jgi:hypothetical protein